MNQNQIILKWGVVGAMLSIILGVVFYLLNMSESKILQYIGVLIMLSAVVLAHFEFRDKLNNGHAEFSDLFKIGLKVSLIIAFFGAVWSFIYFQYIDTEFIAKTLLKTEIQLEEKGLNEIDIKTAMNMTKKFMTPLYMSIMGFFSTAILGLIVTLVSAFLLKKEPTLTEE